MGSVAWPGQADYLEGIRTGLWSLVLYPTAEDAFLFYFVLQSCGCDMDGASFILFLLRSFFSAFVAHKIRPLLIYGAFPLALFTSRVL